MGLALKLLATLSRKGIDMKTVIKQRSETFVKESKLISKPGAVIKVSELTLTDFGIRAITSGSEGIRQGARENAGPPSPWRKLEPAT